MKKIALLFVFILSACTLSAQWNPWSDAEPLTDSVTYNSNPDILLLLDKVYMFYEKKADTNSNSMIYYRDIKNMTGEQLLFGNPDYIYRNPVLCAYFDFSYSDKFLLYESNESGNFDIYAIEIFEDGTFGTPVQLTNTTVDENTIYSETAINRVVTWESEGDIYVSRLIKESDTLYLNDITLLDSGNCQNPVCGGEIIGYLKVENDSAHFYTSKLDSLPFYWSNPKAIDSTGDCKSLSINTETYNYTFNDPYFLWDKAGKIYCYTDETEIIEIPGDSIFSEVHQPCGFPFTSPEKAAPTTFISFVANIDGNQNVFSCFHFYYLVDNPFNLSQNSLINSNPKMFFGWETGAPCERYIVDIWETHSISGGVSLWISKTGIYNCGGVDENETQKLSLKFSPNPFTNDVNIEFYQTSGDLVEIDIYSITGNHISTLITESPVYGWNTIKWTPEKEVPKGVYNVVVKQNGIMSSSKIIKD